MRFVNIAVAFIIAVLTVTVLGTASHSIFVLNELAAIGVTVEGQYLSSILNDLAGMGPLYGALMAIGFVIAFIAAHFVQRLAPSLRWFVYMVAGAVSVYVTLTVMGILFDITPIAGARSALGMAFQAGAGAVAGLVYALMTPRRD